MMLKTKNIFLISPEPWDHIFVSKHHYAIHLARSGNHVYFLNPPSRNKISVLDTEYSNLKQVNYPGFITGLRFLPSIIQKRVIRRMLNRIEHECSVHFDIIWSFDNSVFYDFSAVRNSILKISHIVDLSMDFNTRKAASTANFCFGVSGDLVNRLQKFNNQSYFVNHGLNLDNGTSNQKKKITLPGENKIKATYIGNLGMKFIDWELLYSACDKFDMVDFIFIGPSVDDLDPAINKTHIFKSELKEKQNAFFVPKIPSEEIYYYLEVSDILLVAYQQEHHKDQANPHKMMEYLSSGKPVVATYTEAYSENDHLIYMSDKINKNWLNRLEFVINHSEEVNHPDKVLSRKEWAISNTYEKQISRIQEIINLQNG